MASGRLLLFLHADTLMTATACRFLSDLSDSNPNLFAQDAQGHPYYWGFFRITLSGRRAVFRLIERLITVRSRITSVATGDQAMFVSRALFEEVGGFPSMLLMEDVALSKRLRKRVRPICSGLASVETSSRRWESKGVLATVLMMWGLRFAYWMKMSPDLLAKFYR